MRVGAKRLERIIVNIKEYAAKMNVTLTDEQAAELQRLHERYQAIGWPDLIDHVLPLLTKGFTVTDITLPRTPLFVEQIQEVEEYLKHKYGLESG